MKLKEKTKQILYVIGLFMTLPVITIGLLLAFGIIK